MSATTSADLPLPYLHRSAGRAQVPRPDRGSAGRGRATEAQWYPSYEEQPRSGGPGGPGGPSGPGGPGGGGGGPGRRGPRPRWGRIGLVAGVAVLVLALLGAGGAWFYARNLNDDLARTDPFSEITAGRPTKTVDGALNILLVGSDSRDPDAPVETAGKWRADTVIVMHVPADHKHAYLVSIPRDLYVPIPESAGAACDSGQRAKINAAFAFGGLPLAVRTVECFTDVRIDHVMAIDFAGFKQVTDALGGVDLKVERTITSIHKPYRTFTEGVNHMDGAEALDWIRQRKQFPEGDFARMRHQQEFLRALLDKAASTGTLTNPKKLNDFLRATTDAVTVDQGFSLVDMAMQFRSLRGADLTFLTSPNLGSDMINGESVVVSDREKALAMYQAMSADTMADWVKANQQTDGAQSGG
ncbi:transcriptional attenuator, LytR family [Micromonospora rhizosphaerae]|uniref:Transcriptional attenuator, LytR family n=1 Tax=Micromonospora rhizosphaerae TaxID=568872 RepID=A0A1C6REI2_9ACTN|nr:LCP family protein [Micromonospora rhizosphaerae]SCL15577.1 transcriptional attenuator, LytR family [Micromonospora rhizosphaerae]